MWKGGKRAKSGQLTTIFLYYPAFVHPRWGTGYGVKPYTNSEWLSGFSIVPESQKVSVKTKTLNIAPRGPRDFGRGFVGCSQKAAVQLLCVVQMSYDCPQLLFRSRNRWLMLANSSLT